LNFRWKIAQAAEIRWWQNYLSGKSETEYLTWKQDYWKKFLEQINVQPSAGEDVLDMGCGPAGVYIGLAEQRVVAVDPLLAQYEISLDYFSFSTF